ncbi:UDP-glycosyltransferase 92A1 [Camellia lanceoleosa]|nr:UDP-glycosyltransferase 92A1 [Camellia lanceoleosa]
MFFGWSAKVAHEFGAFHAIFNAGGGYGMAAFHSLWLHLPYKKVNSEEFPLPGFRKGHRIHTKQLPEHFQVAVAGDSWCSFSQDMFRDWLESDGILFNTMEEIDHVGMEYFRQQIGCSVWPVGPILSSLGSKARAGDDAEATMHLCMKWLDSKPANSVLYVAFGSQSAPSPSQTIQLAMALEACGKNFIWVMGLCVGVASGSREVNHKDIVKKIDLVMSGSTKGQDMKNKACEVMEMLNNAKNDEKGFKGSSAKAMEDFLYAALSKSCNY